MDPTPGPTVCTPLCPVRSARNQKPYLCPRKTLARRRDRVNKQVHTDVLMTWSELDPVKTISCYIMIAMTSCKIQQGTRQYKTARKISLSGDLKDEREQKSQQQEDSRHNSPHSGIEKVPLFVLWSRLAIATEFQGGKRRHRSYGTISKFKKMLPGTRISDQMMQWILETEAAGLEGGLDRRWGGAKADVWFLGGFPQYPNVH